MPTYKAPVESVLFLLKDVLGYERYSNLPGFADAPLDTVEAVLGEAARFCEEVLQPLNRVGDSEGCTRHDDGSVTTPTGFKEAYRELFARPAGSGSPPIRSIGGQGLPYVLAAVAQRVHHLRQHGVRHVSGPDAGRDRRARPARLGRAEGALPAKAHLRRMVGHDEPDGAAMRHRSRADQDEGRARRRRQLPDHRPEDLHLGRRARPDRRTSCTWCWRASKARRRARRASRSSSCRNSCPTPTAMPARGTPSPAARSRRRWASTATPPAS